MNTEYHGWTHKELANESDSDSSGPATDEVFPPKKLRNIFNSTEKSIWTLQDENNALKIRLAKLEKTVSVLEAIRKQSEKDRLEEMMNSTYKQKDDNRTIILLETIIKNQHLSENGLKLIPIP
jgi:hypothetical protein